MSLIKKMVAAPPSPEERAAEASASAESALRVFGIVADDLADAAAVLDEVEEAANIEADRHRGVAISAANSANRYRAAADKVRALLS